MLESTVRQLAEIETVAGFGTGAGAGAGVVLFGFVAPPPELLEPEAPGAEEEEFDVPPDALPAEPTEEPLGLAAAEPALFVPGPACVEVPVMPRPDALSEDSFEVPFSWASVLLAVLSGVL